MLPELTAKMHYAEEKGIGLSISTNLNAYEEPLRYVFLGSLVQALGFTFQQFAGFLLSDLAKDLFKDSTQFDMNELRTQLEEEN